ncbi:Serine/threonine-protein kinase 10, partial [Geodia barretti]
MEWFSKLFGRSGKAKREFPNLTRGKDPLELWNKTGELGDGAFGKVYKAENRETGVLAALKRVPIQDETELEDFMVEIDILTECKHRNIVDLYQAFFHDSALWIFIEFCAGGAVDDIIIELDHGLSEPQIRCITHQMLQALECLHTSGCIHRDLKAGNILLCPDGSIRLADFGVSARPNKGQQQKKRDTFIGTPYWMAPEVVVCETNKDAPYDQKADIWSVGITLIELADMNPPYHEMSPMRVLLKITRSDPPTVELPHKWSKEFNSFLRKCLTKNPETRSSATELLQHPFVASVSHHKPLRALYQEVKSEVVELVEELPEDADITTQEEHTETTVGDRGHTAAIPNGMCEPNTVRQETFEGRNFRVLKKHISRRKLPCIFAGYSIQILPPTKFAEKTF